MAVGFSPDGHRVFAASGSDVGVWDREQLTRTQYFKLPNPMVASPTFSADGRRLLFYNSGWENHRRVPQLDRLRLWDVDEGKEIKWLGHNSPHGLRCLTLSGDGRRALGGMNDNSVWLWELESGEAHRFQEKHRGSITSVAFSRFGGLALSGAPRHLLVWDVDARTLLRRIDGLQWAPNCLAFSPNSRRALTGEGHLTRKAGRIEGVNCAVRLWDVANGEALQYVGQHSKPVKGVAFSPDGRLALSAGDDAIRLWDLERGVELRALVPGGASVAFSPDGRDLLAGCSDHVIRIWRVPETRHLPP